MKENNEVVNARNTYKTAPTVSVPYTPDTWSILLFNSPTYGKIHKVFGGWYGGYTQGDSWKLSSGMKDLVDEGDFYSSVQESGSIYQLYKNSEKFSVYQLGILSGFEEQLLSIGGSVVVVNAVDYVKEKPID